MANIHASVAEPMSGNLKAEKCLVEQSFRSATKLRADANTISEAYADADILWLFQDLGSS